jgi:hypothetical protein
MPANRNINTMRLISALEILAFAAAAFWGSPVEAEYCIPPIMTPAMIATPAIILSIFIVGLMYLATKQSCVSVWCPVGQQV